MPPEEKAEFVKMLTDARRNLSVMKSPGPVDTFLAWYRKWQRKSAINIVDRREELRDQVQKTSEAVAKEKEKEEKEQTPVRQIRQ